MRKQKKRISTEQRSKPWLVVLRYRDEILPSCVGIRISHDKDPYEPTGIMECHIQVLSTAQLTS